VQVKADADPGRSPEGKMVLRKQKVESERKNRKGVLPLRVIRKVMSLLVFLPTSAFVLAYWLLLLAVMFIAPERKKL